MKSLAKLSKSMPSTLSFYSSLIPHIQINGIINLETTLFVDRMLAKIPKNKSRLVISINSVGGCLAQTHIIIKKINQLAKRNSLTVLTHGEEFALNAGFLLLLSGNQVHIDRTSIIGGLEFGPRKITSGKLNDYIKTITYSNQPTLFSQLNRDQEMDSNKKQQAEAIFKSFKGDVEERIRKLRSGKIHNQTELNNYFTGEEAKEKGLVDQVGNMYEILHRDYPTSTIKLLDLNPFQKLIKQVRRLNISD